MQIMQDIVYDATYACCKLDLYLPDARNGQIPLFVSVHGGGLVEGDKGGEGREKLARSLTESGVAMASVNYRMYPEAKFPEFIQDVANATGFLLNQYGFLGNVAIGGESAGGYITQMLYFNKEYLQSAGVDLSQVKAFVMDAGQPTTHFNVLNFERKLDGRAVVIDEAAALYYLREEYKQPEKEPYVAIFAADRDMVNRLEQNKMLETAMLHFGFPREKLLFHVFENYFHCAYTCDDIYIQMVTDFLKQAFGL